MSEQPDLRDILERIRCSWDALCEDNGIDCDCAPPGQGEACDICEITYLLSEALDGP